MRVPAHPGLYDVEGDTPSLNGTRCSVCGRTYFPPLAIGCERCGAREEHLVAIALPATGIVHSLATVHHYQGEPKAPFTIGEIRLDAGPLIRAMVSPDARGLAIGDAVAATWATVGVDAGGNEVVEPAFSRRT